MRCVRVVNRTRGQVLADSAELADSAWKRFLGLMGRRDLPPGGGLVLKPGGAIHMFFMRMPLDVLHVDRAGRVTHVLRGIRPGRLGPLFVGGALAIELPGGTAIQTQPGDEIVIEGVTRPS
jgi:uncharacterized membrane protein (UPF0127 family)